MAKLNRTTFFAYVRNAPFGGRLSTGQVDGMTAILDHWVKSGLTDERWLAYMLATAFHETAQTMQAVRETLLKTDKAVVAALDKAFASGRLKSVKTPYWRPDANGRSWYGRGLVQLTFEANYKTMARLLGVPLDKDPSLALDMNIAIDIMFEGMTKGVSNRGDFTKYSLEDFFNGHVEDPIGARKIINGTDKAKLIAGYYQNFLDAIRKATEAAATGTIPAEVTPAAAKPDDKPASQSKSVLAVVGTVAGSGILSQTGEIIDKGSSALSLVNNPWQFASLAALLIGLGVLIWLFSTGRLTLFRNEQVVK